MIILGHFINLTLLFWLLAGIFGIVLLFLWSRYNGFIRARNNVKTDFADIDVQLRRRASLIENLASVVREYAKHEKTTFSDVTKARAALEQTHDPKKTAQADNMLTAALRSLFAVSEAYPDLLASRNYQSLTADIKETEDLISRYREEYNQTVLTFNTMIQTFPNMIAAQLFKFGEEELFAADAESKKEIKLKSE